MTEQELEEAKRYEEEYDKLWEEANKTEEGKEPPEEEEEAEEAEPQKDDNDNDEEEEQAEEEEPQKENKEEEEEKEEPDDNSTKQEGTKEEVFKLKAVGTELELTKDEVVELAKKGIDYTKKTQWIAENKKRIELVEGVPDEHLNALKALKEGNKEALVLLAKEYNIDLYDLDTDKEPEVEDYLTTVEANESSRKLKEIESRILADEGTLPKVKHILNVIPDDFKKNMAEKPELLEALYVDIKAGKAEPTISEALKQYYINGGDFLQHYASAYNKLFNKEVEPPSEEASRAREKATMPKRKEVRREKKDYLKDAEEIWSMPSDDFRKIKAKVMAKVGIS